LSILLCAGLATASDSWAANTFDGIYKGTLRVTRSSNGTGCLVLVNEVRDITVVVKNNHFRKWMWGGILEVDVAADGSFEANAFSSGLLFGIKGNITGVSFEADQGNPYCIQHLSLKRS